MAWPWNRPPRRAWYSTRLTSRSRRQGCPLPGSPHLLTLLMFAAAACAAPADLDDGLLVAAPADVSLFRAPLETLTPAVVAAEFPDTTSVLVFKDERLVFERYFGAGGINVLNNTRSVTKTLTALIVGQALVRRRTAFRRSARLRTAHRSRPLPPTTGRSSAASRSWICSPCRRRSTAMTSTSAMCGNEENMYPLTNWTRWVVDLPVKADYRAQCQRPRPVLVLHRRDAAAGAGRAARGAQAARSVFRRTPVPSARHPRAAMEPFTQRRVHDRRRPGACAAATCSSSASWSPKRQLARRAAGAAKPGCGACRR